MEVIETFRCGCFNLLMRICSSKVTGNTTDKLTEDLICLAVSRAAGKFDRSEFRQDQAVKALAPLNSRCRYCSIHIAQMAAQLGSYGGNIP